MKRHLLLALSLAGWALPAFAGPAQRVPSRVLLEIPVAPGHEPGTVRVSPDGRRLLYGVRVPECDETPPDYDLWVAGLDGKQRKRLARHARWAEWSPDGTRISYVDVDRVYGGRGVSTLWSVRPDGSGAKARSQVLHDPWGLYSPYQWSPDGNRIAYVTREKGEHGQSLWVMSAAGTQKRKLLEVPEALRFHWSPDSARLCAGRVIQPEGNRPRRDPRSHAYVIECASGRVEDPGSPLAGALPGACAFSPDKRHFALVCYGPETDAAEGRAGSAGEVRKVQIPRISVWLQDLSDNSWQRILSCKGWDAALSWSPRGDRVAVMVYDDALYDASCRFALWRANGERICAFRQGMDLRWSPAGGRIAFRCEPDGPTSGLAVCDNAGGRPALLASGLLIGGDDFCWMPEGLSLAVVSGEAVRLFTPGR